MWYNEEYLAPYFLKHYSWADKIHIILDRDTCDNTEAIARQFPNVEIDYIQFPGMLDDIVKIKKFNHKYTTLTEADYVILVDSDEFIYCNDINVPVKSHLERTGKDIYFVNLWQIYENQFDLPMSLDVPVPYLRRHGDPDMEDAFNITYIKPAIVRGSRNICWDVGNHEVIYDGNSFKWATRNIETMKSMNVSIGDDEMRQGSHWRLVNLKETIKRRIHNRKNRMSATNLHYKLGSQYHDITEEEIIAEYNKNKNRPIVVLSKGMNTENSPVRIPKGSEQRAGVCFRPAREAALAAAAKGGKSAAHRRCAAPASCGCLRLPSLPAAADQRHADRLIDLEPDLSGEYSH